MPANTTQEILLADLSPTRDTDTGNETAVGPHGDATTGTSRWQKVVGIIALVLVLLFVISRIAGVGGGLGQHGPGGATSGGDTEVEVPGGEAPGGHVPPPGVPDHG
jgi:hypothetical protein